MFYVYKHKVIVTDPDLQDPAYPNTLHLTKGVIHQVDVMFQSGCAHETHVQIWQANRQIWPTNRGATLTGDATIISFREFQPVAPGSQILTIKSWYDETEGVSGKYIEVHIGLLPKKIIQPLSFEELLAAAAGIE